MQHQAVKVSQQRSNYLRKGLGVMDDDLQRPVRSSDFFVIISGFFLNLISAFEALAEDLHHMSIYYTNQKSQEAKVWQEFAQDLETIKENNDG
jgi:hypothetical protein